MAAVRISAKRIQVDFNRKGTPSLKEHIRAALEDPSNPKFKEMSSYQEQLAKLVGPTIKQLDRYMKRTRQLAVPLMREVEESAKLGAQLVNAFSGVLERYPHVVSNWQALLDTPAMRQYQESLERFQEYASEISKLYDRAIGGDNDALIALFEMFGYSLFGNSQIEARVDSLDPAIPSERNVRRRIALIVKAHLVGRGSPGRHPKISITTFRFVAKVQDAFQGAPRLKRQYRNPAARVLDIKGISEHVAASVPPNDRVRVERAARAVLEKKPRMTKAFGIEVMAEILSCRPRSIRSAMKRRQL